MDSYHQIIKYLYSLEYSGIKLGLENVRQLLSGIGNPQNSFPAIHLAGTNGKGSTAAFIYSVCREAGYKTGLYTSPHLIDFSERIRVNGQNITWETIVEYTRMMRGDIDRLNATFFEATTAIALRYFAEQNVDVAVVETGLGGRLDATNLVNPLATVITSISFDHMQYLGDSIREIAGEKAGIIKRKIPCVTNNRKKEVVQVLEAKCREMNTVLHTLDPERNMEILEESVEGSRFHLKTPGLAVENIAVTLAGRHQAVNAALAILALHHAHPLSFTGDQYRQGLLQTRWPGRLQIINRSPLAILDVAHNPDGFEKVFSFLNTHLPGKTIWCIVGLSRDKDFVKIADILRRHCLRVAVVDKFSERGLESGRLLDLLQSDHLFTDKFDTVDLAYYHYKSRVPEAGLLLIIGSHYLAGEFLKKIQLS